MKIAEAKDRLTRLATTVGLDADEVLAIAEHRFVASQMSTSAYDASDAYDEVYQEVASGSLASTKAEK